MNFHSILNHLLEKKDLDASVCYQTILDFLQKTISPIQFASFLSLLQSKGITPDEVYGTVCALKKKMRVMDSNKPILVDTCGTGGDRKISFNISTLSAFVVAGCDIPVVKHGNRSVSSQCGSADILEQLGFDLQSSTDVVQNTFSEIGFTFLFAPLYHLAFKTIAPIRKELGIPTIFNLLGPLLNPYSPNVQIMGLPDTNLVELMVSVWEKLHYNHVFSGCLVSEKGYDEIVLMGSFSVKHFYQNKWYQYTFNPSNLGLKTYQSFEIESFIKQLEPVRLFKDILSPSGHFLQDIVVINAAIAIYAYRCIERQNVDQNWIGSTIKEAQQSIATGNAQHKLKQLILRSKNKKNLSHYQ